MFVRCGQSPVCETSWHSLWVVISRFCWQTVLTSSVYRTFPIDTVDMRWLYGFKICIFICWPGAQMFSYWTVRQKIFTINGKKQIGFCLLLPQTNLQVFQFQTPFNALDCPSCSKLQWFVFLWAMCNRITNLTCVGFVCSQVPFFLQFLLTSFSIPFGLDYMIGWFRKHSRRSTNSRNILIRGRFG